MEDKQHARLSASSAHRWLECPPSVKLEEQFEDVTSPAADEGTAAHALAEHKLKKALHIRSERPVSGYVCDDMEMYTDDYVSYVMESFQEANLRDPAALIMIEQKVYFDDYVPEGFGTCDAMIVDNSEIHIIDFKYGVGVLVDAKKNTQMMLYALGAINGFDFLYDFDTVKMTIFQPRRENVSVWTISVGELREWAENTLKPTALLAYEGKGEYHSGSHCQFCKARNLCRARAEASLDMARYEFAMPPTLLDEEVSDILVKIPELMKWAKDIEAYALDAALHGKQWEGFKLVAGRSTRRYSDEDKVIEACHSAGYHDIFNKKLIGLTEMTRLMGKEQFNNILGDLIVRKEGSPTLVPLSDKRKALVMNAEEDFKTYKEEK